MWCLILSISVLCLSLASLCVPQCALVFRGRAGWRCGCAERLPGGAQDQQCQGTTHVHAWTESTSLHLSSSPLSICYLSSSTSMPSVFSIQSCPSLLLCLLYFLLPIQFIPGHSPRAANGLLSPPLEDPVRASQSSLCDMLQEKEKKTSTSTGTGTSLGMAGGTGATGTGMDHSALIQLRAKNFREKSDAHFVDVIREDRWETRLKVEFMTWYQVTYYVLLGQLYK